MDIQLTDEAVRKLEQLWPAGKVLRVIGELVGGCGMNVEYSLVWDERDGRDIAAEINGRFVVTDAETADFIGAARITIDYRENQGFRLVTPGQIVAYGLAVKERWT
jgi:Fe-S cluster assembly iron-binding protein IscA